MMTFDEKLKQALGETFEERMMQRMTVTKKHRFSLAYRLWERKVLSDLRKNRRDSRWTLKKARHIVASAVVASSLLFGTTAFAASAMIGRYSFDSKPDYSKIFIENISSDKKIIEEYYGLPEENGWKVTYIGGYDDLTLSHTQYKNGEKNIVLDQKVIDGNMGHINTENAVVEPISLYEENDGFFIEFQGGDCGLWWIYDGYMFSLLGNIDKNELVNLAYSTKIINFCKNF